MFSTLVDVWRDATLSPRRGLPRLLREEPLRIALVFPMAAGVLQSLVQGASNDMGARLSAGAILLLATPIGAVWGLLQLHVLSAALWVTARTESGRVPFRRVRYAVALSSAPTSYAFLAWVISAVILGRALFVSPELAASSGAGAGVLLHITLLYLGTVACVVWYLVLLILGIKEITGGSVIGAVGRVILALLIMVVVVIVAVVVGMSAYSALYG